MSHRDKSLRESDCLSVLDRRAFRVVTLALLGAALAWKILVTNLMPHLVGSAPGAALFLAADNPSVVFEFIDGRINPEIAGKGGAETSGATVSAPVVAAAERERLRVLAQSALSRSPLDARALRILGQLAPDAAAGRFMETAARRSMNEYRAHYWVMKKRFSDGRYAEALRSADILLRIRPQLVPFIAPHLARMAEERAAAAELERALAQNPPWRERFLTYLPQIVADVRAPLRLMLALKDTPHPSSPESQRRYLELLFERQAYDFAYYAWRRLLPPERSRAAATLYNGDFHLPISGQPFDWLLSAGAGARIGVAPRPDDDRARALLIDYGPGRVAPHSVAQFFKLAAGRYRMAGQYRGELAGRRGPRWRVGCLNMSGALGQSEMAMGRISDWRNFQFDFVVPDQNCPLQSVRLELDARSPSEWMVSGEIWYAELKIEPIDGGAPATR